MGNRASEVLGLAWDDIDFDAGTATIRRGSTYTRSTGQRLDDPKSRNTAGVHFLPPTVVAALLAHRERQDIERATVGSAWVQQTYRGRVTTGVKFRQWPGNWNFLLKIP